MDEQDINHYILENHQDRISMYLSWAGVEEERAVYLADHNNVVRDLADCSPDDWTLVRAAGHHIAGSESLDREHNRWLGQKILANFEREAHYHLLDLVQETRSDRPVLRPDPQEMFPHRQLTAREATHYYSRAALALLVSRDDPNQAIALLEELSSIFDPRIRILLPGSDRSLWAQQELGRLPTLYERVERFEDALNVTPISFNHVGSETPTCDVACRRLEGWLNQLSRSGGVSAVERCLDMIYGWLDGAGDVDEEERDHVGECPTATRQFWAWYYGNALGRLLVARPSLRTSLLDEIEAGEWDNCWHVAGVLFETAPHSWDEYRERALKFYNASDIEYPQQGPRPWNAVQPPHLSAQSDLYWAMRIGFADAHAVNAEDRKGSLAGITDALERIETITSGTARHVLRAERNIDNLMDTVNDRVIPNHEYWYGLLREELPDFISGLPRPTVDHLIDAYRHRSAMEWDYCKVSLCKSVESLFVRILVPGITALPESSNLTIALPRGKRAPRKRSSEEWHNISMSGWAQILRTATDGGINAPLRAFLPHAFPDIDLDSAINLHAALENITQLRGGAAHDSITADGRKVRDAEELWDLVMGAGSGGFLAQFCSALGLAKDPQETGNADGA